MLSLLKFFQNTNDRRQPVAITDHGVIDFSTFEHDVKQLSALVSQRQELQWGLYCEDAYRFTVALFALLYSHKKPILLPNVQDGFVERVQAKLDAVILDKAGLKTSLPMIDLASDEIPESREFSFPELDEALSEISLYTSGTSGEPQRIIKKISQLEAELQVLEQQWGDVAGDAVFLSTVSQQHIYGLLFRVLWPLLSRRCFDARTYQFPEPLLQQVLQHTRTVLISSPAHLKRMPELIDLSVAKEKIVSVFSSGGPLPIESAINVYAALNVGVVEVFGSTETGGIAYRSQTQREQLFAWAALPMVEIKIREHDSRLLIKSPFEGSDDWFEMGDRARFVDDTHFELMGRADKIVKIEEKRLSLIEVEQRLLDSQWVAEAAATVLQNKRSSVAVVIVLTELGQQLLEEKGLLQLKQTLTDYLSNHFEAVVLPKRWRFLSALPYNTQGKLPQSELKKLFAVTSNDGYEPEVLEPEIKVVTQTNERIELELYVPGNLLYFDGHFPDQPILPGVVQIDWAASLGKRFFTIENNFKDMEAIKFHEFIKPEDTIKLDLSYDADKRKLHFSFESSKGKHSSGRLVCE